jgi:hypothetical protein
MSHLSFAFVESYHVHDVLRRCGPDSRDHYKYTTERERKAPKQKENGG